MFKAFDELFAHKYKMFETVYNKEKKEVQVVLAAIPMDNRQDCGMPKMKRSYICAKPGENTWTIELGEHLRPATIFERARHF